jgi:hypothetical protein
MAQRNDDDDDGDGDGDRSVALARAELRTALVPPRRVQWRETVAVGTLAAFAAGLFIIIVYVTHQTSGVLVFWPTTFASTVSAAAYLVFVPAFLVAGIQVIGYLNASDRGVARGERLFVFVFLLYLVLCTLFAVWQFAAAIVIVIDTTNAAGNVLARIIAWVVVVLALVALIGVGFALVAQWLMHADGARSRDLDAVRGSASTSAPYPAVRALQRRLLGVRAH